MSRHTRGEKPEESFADLDKMVLAEIELLTDGRAPSRSRPHAAGMRVVDDRHPDRPTAVDDEPSGDKVVALTGANPGRGEFFGEEATTLLEPEDELGNQGATSEDVPDDSMEPGTEIFSPEEQAFITRALGFLSGRENADMILGRVWEEVTASSSPDAFFSPGDEQSASAPTTQPSISPEAEPPSPSE